MVIAIIEAKVAGKCQFWDIWTAPTFFIYFFILLHQIKSSKYFRDFINWRHQDILDILSNDVIKISRDFIKWRHENILEIISNDVIKMSEKLFCQFSVVYQIQRRHSKHTRLAQRRYEKQFRTCSIQTTPTFFINFSFYYIKWRHENILEILSIDVIKIF